MLVRAKLSGVLCAFAGVSCVVAGEKQMSDPCFDGLTRNVEVTQLHLRRGLKKERKFAEFVEAGDVGKAWTCVRPELRKEWDGEK